MALFASMYRRKESSQNHLAALLSVSGVKFSYVVGWDLKVGSESGTTGNDRARKRALRSEVGGEIDFRADITTDPRKCCREVYYRSSQPLYVIDTFEINKFLTGEYWIARLFRAFRDPSG